MRREPRVGRPTAAQKPRAEAGCSAWVRAAQVKTSDSLIDPPGLLVSTVNPSRRWVAQVWRLPGNVHAVTPDQKPPVEAHGHRRRRERSLGPPLPLGMDVQMRLAAFAGITDFTDLLTLSEAVPSGDPKRSLPEMAKQDVGSIATQKNMVALRMALI